MDLDQQKHLTSLVLAIIAIYIYITWKLNYWKNRGIKGPRPLPLFGNFIEIFFKKLTAGETVDKIYKKWKKLPYVGVYKGHQPQLIINDLDLIKKILIKDFDTFYGRGIVVNEMTDPLTEHLFNIEGPKWKALRAQLSPIFTSSKLKSMLTNIIECSNDFEKYIDKKILDNNVIDCRDAAIRFSTDIMGSCGFGIKTNALTNSNSEFYNFSKKTSSSDFHSILKRFMREIQPELFKLLKINLINKKTGNFFINSMKEVVELRKNKNIIKNDLTDLILKSKNDDNEFDECFMIVQSFILFVAGVDMISITISLALLELAIEPKIQDKLRHEIIETLNNNNDGKLTCDVINNMKYLDMVVLETLRKNPPLLTLARESSKPYKIPGSNTIIDKGIKFTIPVYSIHHDPDYYPNPEKFDPERFCDEAKAKRHPMAFCAFGQGNKNCIGIRFAANPIKLGIMTIIKKWLVKPSKSTVIPFEMDKGSVILAPTEGIHLLFEPIL